MSIIKTAVQRLDYFYNAVSGLGAPGSAFRQNVYAYTPTLEHTILSSLWNTNWLAERVVRSYPDHALKQGFEIDDDELKVRFKQLNYGDLRYPDGLFQTWQYQARLYGGAGLLLGLRGTSRSLTSEIDPEVGGELAFLDIIPKHQVKILSTNQDANSAKFGAPEVIEIVGNHRRRGLQIHTSRILWAAGKPLFGEQSSAQEEFLGISVLQAMLEILQQSSKSWAAFAGLIEESSIGVLKQKGLFDALASEDQVDYENRVALLQRLKSTANLLLLDAESGEDFRRENVDFTGLSSAMQELRALIAGSVEIPEMILFGQSAAGLNATGETELVQFNDRVEAYRNKQLKPALETLLTFMSGGSSVEVEFKPLLSPSELENEEVRAKRAATDKTYFDMGALEAEDIILARAKSDELGFELPKSRLRDLKQNLEDALNDDTPDPVPPIGNFLGAANPVEAVGQPIDPRNPEDEPASE